jgi:hypothetical protein
MNLRALLVPLLLVIAGFASAAVPATAVAQSMPGGMSANDPYHIYGRVDAFDGKFSVIVHGMHVRLHQGTIIHPTGATITPGQFVIVRGHWVGHHFDADEVRIRH